MTDTHGKGGHQSRKECNQALCYRLFDINDKINKRYSKRDRRSITSAPWAVTRIGQTKILTVNPPSLRHAAGAARDQSQHVRKTTDLKDRGSLVLDVG